MEKSEFKVETKRFKRKLCARSRPAVVLAAIGGHDMTEAVRPFLSSPERQAAERFRFRADSNAYSAAHFVLRICLSTIADPRDWSFISGVHGKPSLHPDNEIEGFHFNISHSRTHVACALSFDGAVGVDTEDNYTSTDLLEVAALVSSASEQASLEALPPEARSTAFAQLWTAKEAIAKASGKGLNHDLRNITIDLETGSFVDAGEGLGDISHWKIEHRHFGKTHVAVAIRSPTRTAEAITFDWYRLKLDRLFSDERCESWIEIIQDGTTTHLPYFDIGEYLSRL